VEDCNIGFHVGSPLYRRDELCVCAIRRPAAQELELCTPCLLDTEFEEMGCDAIAEYCKDGVKGIYKSHEASLVSNPVMFEAYVSGRKPRSQLANPQRAMGICEITPHRYADIWCAGVLVCWCACGSFQRMKSSQSFRIVTSPIKKFRRAL
jgi:hypothetical protein